MSPSTVLPPSAVALAALARKRGFAELAKRVDCSEGMIRHAARGRRTPSVRLRTVLFERLGISFDGWTAPAVTVMKAATGSGGSSGGTPRPPSTMAQDAPARAAAPARALLDRYRDLATALEAELDRARKDPDTATRDIAALGQSLARCLAHIGRLTGEHEITEAMVVRHPAFGRAVAVLREALRPYPDASRAAAAAFAKLLGGSEAT